MKAVHRIERTAEEIISLPNPGYSVTVRLQEGRVPVWLNIRREGSTILRGKNSCEAVILSPKECFESLA